MGEIAEMMMDGMLCRECGADIETRRMREAGAEVVIRSHPGTLREVVKITQVPGYPVPCEDCAPKWKVGE